MIFALMFTSCKNPYNEILNIYDSLNDNSQYTQYSQEEWVYFKSYFDECRENIDLSILTPQERSDFELKVKYCEDIFATKVQRENEAGSANQPKSIHKDTLVIIQKEVIYVVDTTKQGGALPIVDNSRRETFWDFYHPEENVNLLQIACDYNAPSTKQFANKLAKEAGTFGSTINIEQICEIYDYCRSKWSYINDPKGHEYLARASETIASDLTGDCDDFATLIASCILAVGGETRINLAFGPDGGHAFTEVEVSHLDWNHIKNYIGQRFNRYDMEYIYYNKENDNIWLNLDWQSPYPGGKYFDSTEIYCYKCIDGKWIY